MQRGTQYNEDFNLICSKRGCGREVDFRGFIPLRKCVLHSSQDVVSAARRRSRRRDQLKELKEEAEFLRSEVRRLSMLAVLSRSTPVGDSQTIWEMEGSSEGSTDTDNE